MNIVFIIPTGIGCEIGGHAGDATPAVKLIASVCDTIYINPNAVNASDINEMPGNALYVEGSILDRFLDSQIVLKEVYQNKILLLVNKPVRNETINAVNAAKSTIGADIDILELENKLEMEGYINVLGKADGIITGIVKLVEQVSSYSYDAIAIQTEIKVARETKFNYFRHGGVNPWGGVEAMLSNYVANKINKPVAHAPLYIPNGDEEYETLHETLVSDPRMAAEMVSICYLHCILKGLHKAPRIMEYTHNQSSCLLHWGEYIDFLVSPMCYGRPHEICNKKRIPIIYVEENTTIYNQKILMTEIDVTVNNYLEAVGYISCIKAGVKPKSVRR